MFKGAYAVSKYENAYVDALKFVEKGIEVLENNITDETRHLLANLYSMCGSYELQDNMKINKQHILDYYKKAYTLYSECGTLESYDGYQLGLKISALYTSMGKYIDALKILEYFAEYFKPEKLPETQEEFEVLKDSNGLNTISEYYDLLEFICVVKMRMRLNVDTEKFLLKKIRNI